MLVELNKELPYLEVLQYEDELTKNGFYYISQLVGGEVGHCLHDDLKIPLRVVIQLQSRASRLMRRTQKLKQED